MRESGKTFAQIKEVFKISKGNLSAIINKKTWAYLEDASETGERPASPPV